MTLQRVRAGAAQFAMVFAYATAAINCALAVVDLLAKLWLTASIQLTLSLAAVYAAYLVTRAERQNEPPLWLIERAALAAAYGIVLVAIFTLAILARALTSGSTSP